MTTFERFEREIPSLMDEIAPPRLPDYLDDMLRQTGRTRQRPAWASPERWLPMDVVARPTILRAPALRPLLILLLIGLLIAGGALLYAGTQRTRLPAPFGPARNGLIVGTVNEDIVAFDPVTGSTTALIGGATRDIAPWFSRDGRRFMFVRLNDDDTGAYWLANTDGSDAHELIATPVDWFEWSDAGDRIVVTRSDGDTTETSVVDVDSGTSTPLDVDKEIYHPFWRPGHDQIVFSVSLNDAYQDYWIVNSDGTGLKRIEGVAPGAINDPQLSPDGSKIAYATWGTGRERIHVLDIESGGDIIATPDSGNGDVWQDALFSPDGLKILTKHWTGDGPYRLAIIPADGRGEAIPIGPEQPLGKGTGSLFSPDGAQVLAVYESDGSTWLLGTDGSGGEEVDWAGSEFTWQRLAP